jgi:hypothetical protein
VKNVFDEASNTAREARALPQNHPASIQRPKFSSSKSSSL